jgi:hypothetical protein
MKLIAVLFTITTLSLGIGISYAQNSTLNENGKITILETASSNTIILNNASFIGGFATTYIITGNVADIKNSKDLILETITNDFTNSSTVGYVSLPPSNSESDAKQQITNPFVNNEQIRKKIHDLLEKLILDVTNVTSESASITCNFGSSLDSFSCSLNPLVR